MGVAGCTALILAAYGLKDSISVVVPRQYGEIFTFDSMMNLKYEGTLPEKSNIKAILNQDKDFESNILVDQRIMKGSKENGNNEIEIRMFVPEKTNLLPSYVTLKAVSYTHLDVYKRQQQASLLRVMKQLWKQQRKLQQSFKREDVDIWLFGII